MYVTNIVLLNYLKFFISNVSVNTFHQGARVPLKRVSVHKETMINDNRIDRRMDDTDRWLIENVKKYTQDTGNSGGLEERVRSAGGWTAWRRGPGRTWDGGPKASFTDTGPRA